MPAYEVVPGDTVWGLSRRALTEQLGRRPTNAEIIQVVRQVSVPSGNVDLIFPGEVINIPVGPGGSGGPGGGGVRGGGVPVGPGAGSAQYPSDMYPDGPFGPPAAPTPPSFQTLPYTPPANVPPGYGNAPSGGRPDNWQNPNAAPRDDRPYAGRFNPRIIGPGAFDSFRSPENQRYQYNEFDMGDAGDWRSLLGEILGDSAMFVARAPGAAPVAPSLPALPAGPVRPALPSGARPALPSGGGGGLVPMPGGAIPRPPGGWQRPAPAPGQMIFLN